MKRYIIDFEAWTTLEAVNEEDASAQAQVIINTITQLLEYKDIKLDMVVRDDGINEE